MDKLKALLCLMLVSLWLTPPAFAAPPVRVQVAFAPNLASPLGSQIRTIFPAQLQAELSEKPLEGFPAGSRVTIRVENIQLSHDMVSGGFLDDNLPSLDTVEGVALVYDVKGTLLKRIPLIAHSRSHYNLMDVSNEPKRVVALMEIFAYWVPRQVHP